jgi:hypothetical protein
MTARAPQLANRAIALHDVCNDDGRDRDRDAAGRRKTGREYTVGAGTRLRERRSFAIKMPP